MPLSDFLALSSCDRCLPSMLPYCVRPLQQSAIITSLLAVPFLLVPGLAALVLAGYALWLAVLWLAVAVLQRSPAWFSAFKIAVSAAVLFAVGAMVPKGEFYDPYCLQAYGVGLAALGLGWIIARVGLSANPRSPPVMGSSLAVGGSPDARHSGCRAIRSGAVGHSAGPGSRDASSWLRLLDERAYHCRSCLRLGCLGTAGGAGSRAAGRLARKRPHQHPRRILGAGDNASPPRDGSVRVAARHRLGAASGDWLCAMWLARRSCGCGVLWPVWRTRPVSMSPRIRPLLCGRTASSPYSPPLCCC